MTQLDKVQADRTTKQEAGSCGVPLSASAASTLQLRACSTIRDPVLDRKIMTCDPVSSQEARGAVPCRSRFARVQAHLDGEGSSREVVCSSASVRPRPTNGAPNAARPAPRSPRRWAVGSPGSATRGERSSRGCRKIRPQGPEGNAVVSTSRPSRSGGRLRPWEEPSRSWSSPERGGSEGSSVTEVERATG